MTGAIRFAVLSVSGSLRETTTCTLHFVRLLYSERFGIGVRQLEGVPGYDEGRLKQREADGGLRERLQPAHDRLIVNDERVAMVVLKAAEAGVELVDLIVGHFDVLQRSEPCGRYPHERTPHAGTPTS